MVQDFDPVCQMGVSHENQLITHECGSLRFLCGLIMEKLHAALNTGGASEQFKVFELQDCTPYGLWVSGDDYFAYCKPRQGTTISNGATSYEMS